MAWIILGSVAGATPSGYMTCPRWMLKRSSSSDAKEDIDVRLDRPDGAGLFICMLVLSRGPLGVVPSREVVRPISAGVRGRFCLYAEAGMRGGPIVPAPAVLGVGFCAAAAIFCVLFSGRGGGMAAILLRMLLALAGLLGARVVSGVPIITPSIDRRGELVWIAVGGRGGDEAK